MWELIALGTVVIAGGAWAMYALGKARMLKAIAQMTVKAREEYVKTYRAARGGLGSRILKRLQDAGKQDD